MTGPVIPVCTCSPARIDGYVIHRQYCPRSLARKQAERPAESTAVVPAAAIEALASDLRKSAKGIRRATGDHQDGREYEAAADRLDALVAEHQTEPTPERLTDEERAEFASNLRWHFACHAAEPEKGYDSPGIENAVLRIEAIVASRTEPLRAEIIREQMERADALIELDQARAEVERLRKCGARHPSNPTVVPCALDRDDHGDGLHWSSTGCAGSAISWPTAEAEVERLLRRNSTIARLAQLARADLAALRERVAETVERVQGEHRPTGLINSREGCVLCECDATLTVPGGYTRDGLEVEEWAERRAFEAHIAQQVAAALGGEG